MHTCCPGEIILSDLTGVPVRKKQGGLATGPMEQVSLWNIGAIRVYSEFTLTYHNALLTYNNAFLMTYHCFPYYICFFSDIAVVQSKRDWRFLY